MKMNWISEVYPTKIHEKRLLEMNVTIVIIVTIVAIAIIIFIVTIVIIIKRYFL